MVKRVETSVPEFLTNQSFWVCATPSSPQLLHHCLHNFLQNSN